MEPAKGGVMATKLTDDGMTKFEKLPFSILVKDDRYLATLRRDYASMPARERRKAADWEYHSQMASRQCLHSVFLQVWSQPCKRKG